MYHMPTNCMSLYSGTPLYIIVATVGEWYFGCYTEVAVVEGFKCTLIGTRAVGCYIADGCC